jgi:enoyl-[acyl-carrier protein] reductase II
MAALKAAGIKVVPVVASVALAIRLARNGADAVVAEGTEAGGHVGEITTMALIPQVADAVDIPVIAAGGIADGRGVAAAFMLGARGVQVGTRFLVAEECTVSRPYKEMILKAKDTDTVATGRSTGHPVRVLKNKMTREILSLEAKDISPEDFELRMAGTLRAAVKDGDVAYGSVMSGQIAGLVRKEQKAAEIIEELFKEAREIYESRAAICGAGRPVSGDGEGTL